MIKIKYIFSILLFLLCRDVFSQPKSIQPKGSLFIIGGGTRTSELMKSMLQEAHLKSNDYIVVLPMASIEPDTAFYYFKTSLLGLCKNAIVSFNLTKQNQANQAWIDSLARAQLIFIAGGDQLRFMQAVLNTPVYKAIHAAFNNGATIAGTSAGAAVMSKLMITGKEKTDTVYHETFRHLRTNNLDVTEGLGLVTNAIIDQHFIVRSRYNRILSAMADYRGMPCIGIDESTAIIVKGNNVTVTGEGQVIKLSDPVGLQITGKGLIKFNDIKFSIYTSGDKFRLQ